MNTFIHKNKWKIITLIIAVWSAPDVAPFVVSYFSANIRIYDHGITSGELGGAAYFNTKIGEWRVAWNAGGLGSFNALLFIFQVFILPITYPLIAGVLGALVYSHFRSPKKPKSQRPSYIVIIEKTLSQAILSLKVLMHL